MGARLAVVRAGEQGAEVIAARSSSALDRSLVHDAELWIAVATDRALFSGAFQRAACSRCSASGPSAASVSSPSPLSLPVFRRGSGGPDVIVGEGTIHVVLALAHPGAIVACDEKHIVNRMVRPLLRALTKTGSHAHFFGRDSVSVTNGRTRTPAAWVGFAHDATTRRTAFEAFVAVRTPYAPCPSDSSPGTPKGTLESIAGCTLDSMHIAEAMAIAYEACASVVEPIPVTSDDLPAKVNLGRERPWAAACEEAIGWLGAGDDADGVFRVGGDLLVSRDALARLETSLVGASDDEVGAVVDAALGARGVAIEGVRSLQSVRDVIVNARRASRGPLSRATASSIPTDCRDQDEAPLGRHSFVCSLCRSRAS
ncbi:MAG: hypothetical protein M3O50_15095 [Myxococcota bacterium]|nr:hypothetical protein [Myxococcota bacterium]